MGLWGTAERQGQAFSGSLTATQHLSTLFKELLQSEVWPMILKQPRPWHIPVIIKHRFDERSGLNVLKN